MTSKSDAFVWTKIDRLFESRRLVEQGEQLIPLTITSLCPKLRDLQFAIYCLDKYFERTWNLNHQDIATLWSEILRTLGQIVESKQSLEELVCDIRAYQRLEESIRSSCISSLPRLLSYYHLKTCDVRLARNIIVGYTTLALPERTQYLGAWELFDLASEVCDDLNDIDEDLSTFNGNRFLLGLGTLGGLANIESYQEFESLLLRRAAYLRATVSFQSASVVLAWASECLINLRELLRIRSAAVKAIVNNYSESKLGIYREASTRFTNRTDLCGPQLQLVWKKRPLPPSPFLDIPRILTPL